MKITLSLLLLLACLQQGSQTYPVTTISISQSDSPDASLIKWSSLTLALKAPAKKVNGFDNSKGYSFTGFIQPQNDPPSKLTLITPAKNAILSVSGKHEFSWSHRWPLKGPPTFYKIKIVEVKADESPDYAIKNNISFFEKEGLFNYTFQYPVTAPKFEPGKKYAWIIEAGRKPPYEYVKPCVSKIFTFEISF